MKDKPVSASSASLKGKNIGIWIRVSTEDQAQGESPAHHEHRARAYAESKGWHVSEVYDLAGVSGKSVMEHPEAKRMLADVKRGHITGLIFSKLARLARNTRELLDFSDIFRAQNADLVSLQESIDTSTPAGRLFYTMIAAMAQWEREEIADRVSASVTVRAKLGKPLNGTSPYGYQWKDKQLVPHPEQAPIRKLAYELFLTHRRKGVVATMLNERGYRTSTNSKWSDVAVGRILGDPSAKGVRHYNSSKKVGVWSSEAKPESEWITVAVEPIVSEELWNQVNQILEEQTKLAKRPGKQPVHLFAGLAVCHCGAKMYVPSNQPKYVCLKCRTKIPVVDLEGIFYDELKAYFTNPEAVAGHLLNAQKNLVEKERLLQVQKSEIDKVRDEMKRAYEIYASKQITVEGFGELYRPLEERLAALQTELPKLEAEIDLLKVNNLSADEVLSEANQLYARWPKLPTEDKRKVVEGILEKATIGPGDAIELTLSYLPTSEEMVHSQQRLTPGFAIVASRPPSAVALLRRTGGPGR
jgi:site-specific DNA recombinase